MQKRCFSSESVRRSSFPFESGSANPKFQNSRSSCSPTLLAKYWYKALLSPFLALKGRKPAIRRTIDPKNPDLAVLFIRSLARSLIKNQTAVADYPSEVSLPPIPCSDRGSFPLFQGSLNYMINPGRVSRG